MTDMIDVATELRAEIEAALPQLRRMSESDVTIERGAGKWVKKEILGHLIDSASNNHQRFVRAQTVNPFVGPGYEQDVWVSLSGYRKRSWGELLDIWAALNRQVIYLIESVRADRLGTQCLIGANEPVTLEWLMRDYVQHLKHHLAQILGN
jgi:DinB superfamily